MNKIRCDLCGFEFNTKIVREKHYHDYELEDEDVAYPIKTKGRHPILLRNYICSECMDNLDSILRERLIKDGEKYINNQETRVSRIFNKYQDDLEEEKQKTKHISDCLTALKNSKSVLDFSDSFIHELEVNNHIFGTYYLREGIFRLKKEKRYRVSDLSEKYHISFSEIVNPYGMESLVTLKKYKYIVENSVLSGVSLNEIKHIISSIEKDL